MQGTTVGRRKQIDTGAGDELTPEDEIVWFVLGDDGAPVDPDTIWPRRRRAGAGHVLHRRRPPRRRPDERQRFDGPVVALRTEAVRRRGCPEEIQITMLGHPADVTRALLHAPDLPRPTAELTIEAGSARVRRNTVTWQARLRTGMGRQRRVTLQVFGTPSSAVTVLTLVPTRPRTSPSRRFVRLGLRAMVAVREMAQCGSASDAGRAGPIAAGRPAG